MGNKPTNNKQMPDFDGICAELDDIITFDNGDVVIRFRDDVGPRFNSLCGHQLTMNFLNEVDSIRQHSIERLASEWNKEIREYAASK